MRSIFRKAAAAVRVLIKDVSEILGNATLEKKNRLRIVRNLLDMTVDESLRGCEAALKKALGGDPLNGKILWETDIFQAKAETAQKKEGPPAELVFTPDTVVKAQRPFLKKAAPKGKKLKCVDAKALEELMDQRGLEVKGLRDILRKSKKGFKDFLRSFGWSDMDIEDAMRTASAKESPRKAQLVSNKRRKESPAEQVQSEYHMRQEPREPSKATFTKNIVIREYDSREAPRAPGAKPVVDFFSRQTNAPGAPEKE